MTRAYKERIIIDRVWCSAYKTYGGKGAKHKFGRLKREVKKHKANCYKRQRAMLEIQEMIYNNQR
jgi:hypothetical protein